MKVARCLRVLWLGSEVILKSPVGFVAGIFARKDIAEGPQAAPANARVTGAVGLEMPVSDQTRSLPYVFPGPSVSDVPPTATTVLNDAGPSTPYPASPELAVIAIPGWL